MSTLCRVLQAFAWLSIIALGLGIAVLAHLATQDVLPEGATVTAGSLEYSAGDRVPLLVYISHIAFMATAAYAGLCLARLFNLFALRRYFSAESVGNMRRFAWLYIGLTVYAGIAKFVTMSASQGDAVTTRAIDLSSWPGVTALLYSFILLVIVHVLDEARRNSDELDDYI
jgi:hypothetical protein